MNATVQERHRTVSPLAPVAENGAVSRGLWILLAALLLATAFGVWRLLSDGRFRGTREVKGAEVPMSEDEAGLGPAISEPLGERATLLQFSTAFCAPCRATRRTLSEIADVVPGVRHIEIDAEAHLDLVRELGVTRTPTTLILDGAGREVLRAAGAPKKSEVLNALAGAIGDEDLKR